VSLLALLALLGLAAGGAGQTPSPEPTPDPSETSETPPVPLPPLSPPEQVGVPDALDPGPGPGPGWLLRVGMYPGWDSNVRLAFPADAVGEGEASDFAGRASLDLTRRWAGSRSDLAVVLQANGAAYAQQRSLNQAGFGAGVKGTHRPSLHTSLRASGSFADGYARDVSRVVAAGLLLPLVRSRALGSEAGISVGLGARATASLDGSYRSIQFDSSDFPDSSQATAALRLTRQLGSRADAELSYAFDREVPDAGAEIGGAGGPPAMTTHSALLGASGVLRRGLQMKGSLGVLYVPASATAEPVVYPSGSASLALSTRRTRLEASYERVPQLAYGYGRATVTDNGRLAYRLQLGPRTALMCGATRGYGQDPADPLFRLVDTTATVGLTASFGRGYQTGLTYAYGLREHHDGTVEQPPVDSHAVGLSFSKEWAW